MSLWMRILWKFYSLEVEIPFLFLGFLNHDIHKQKHFSSLNVHEDHKTVKLLQFPEYSKLIFWDKRFKADKFSKDFPIFY